VCDDNPDGVPVFLQEKCSGQLLQVTWCVASRKGFLADVSWHWHAHKESGNESCKKHFDRSYLKIIQGKGTVKCTLCNAEGSFKKSIAIPLDEIGSRMGGLPKDKKIYVHCTTGARADMAAQELKKNGFNAFFIVATCECEDGEWELED